MTETSYFDYEALSNDALRGVVKTVLARVAKSGLPGNHHFFIGFDTQADGVHISKRLLEKYPAEMTIVLQHRFWDLTVLDERFEVKLSFDAIPERLVIPFAAIKVFFDPSVPYGLQFTEPDADRNGPAEADVALVSRDTPAPTASIAKKRPTKRKTDKATETDGPATDTPASAKRTGGRNTAETIEPDAPAAAIVKPLEKVPAGNDAKVVSLDQFRKK